MSVSIASITVVVIYNTFRSVAKWLSIKKKENLWESKIKAPDFSLHNGVGGVEGGNVHERMDQNVVCSWG